MTAKTILFITLFFLISIFGFMYISTLRNSNVPKDKIEPNLIQKIIKKDEPSETRRKPDVTTVVGANNSFTIDIYKEYIEQDGNIFLSPFSVSSAMVMVYEGAESNTAEEIQETFYFPQDNELRRSEYEALYDDLNSENEDYEFNVANALWIEKTYKLKPEYVKNVEDFYYGKATSLDYKNKTDDAIKTINKWVSSKTNEKIPTIVNENNVTRMTKVVLTNAIYFKGLWEDAFLKDQTQNEDFTMIDGNKTVVDMMSTGYDPINLNYYDDGDVEVLEIPYKGHDYSMIVFLPETKQYSEFEEEFNIFKYQDYIANLSSREVKVFMPKYKLENTYTLNKSLRELGINDAFGTRANFENMTSSNDLYISDIVHKTFIEVDEEGTEAAAATAVIMMETSMPMEEPEPIIFRADHPFMFVIKNNENGNIMFIGRYVQPE